MFYFLSGKIYISNWPGQQCVLLFPQSWISPCSHMMTESPLKCYLDLFQINTLRQIWPNLNKCDLDLPQMNTSHLNVSNDHQYNNKIMKRYIFSRRTSGKYYIHPREPLITNFSSLRVFISTKNKPLPLLIEFFSLPY